MPEFLLFIFIYFILPSSSYGFDPSALPSSVTRTNVTTAHPYLLFSSKTYNFSSSKAMNDGDILFPSQTLAEQKGKSSGSVSSSSEDVVEGDGETNEEEGPRRKEKNDKDEGQKIPGHDLGNPSSSNRSESEGNNPSLNYHFNDTAASRRRRTLLYENWANSILLNDPSSDSNQFDKTFSSGTNTTKKGRQRLGK